MNNGGFNPFDGVRPDLGPFNKILGDPLSTLLGIAWAVALAISAAYLIWGFVRLLKGHTRYQSDTISAAKDALLWPVVAIIGLASVAAIYGVLATGFQR